MSADLPERKKLIRIAGTALGILSVMIAVIFRVTRDFCQPDYKDRCQWAKCLTDGLLPYRDFNMLQTPLSLYYYSAFFRFSRSLHTGLLAASLLIVLTGVFLFLTARRIRKDAPLLPAALWTVCCVLGQGAIYTSMSVMFWSAALYLYFCFREKPAAWKLVLTALLCCLSFFSKQNTGALCVLSLGLCFIYHWVRTKTPLKAAAGYTAVLLVSYAFFCGLWLLWFAKCGILRDFAENCLFSASQFTGAHGFSAVPDVLKIAVSILIVSLLLKQPEIGVTGAFMAMIAFPIFNAPCSLPSYGMFAVLLATLKKPEQCGKYRKYLYGAVCIGGYLAALNETVFSGMLFWMPSYQSIWLESRTVTTAKHGDLRTVAVDLEERFGDGLLPFLETHRDTVSEYHIADTLGAFYNIYFDRYDKYYDLFLSGNLGRKTPQDVVDETIAQEPGHYFIVWADPDSQSVPGFQDEAVQDALRSIRQRCSLTETLYQQDGTTPSYCVYQIP